LKENIPILEMKNISKSFGPVRVLNGVDLTLNRGEVLGLIGENGAGKSTMIKIICGIHKKDSGEIFYNGEKIEIESVAHSQQLGISTIYQELSLMPDLNAAQNIFLNRELNKKGNNLVAPLNSVEMGKKAQQILKDELHINIPVDRPLKYMTLAQKQMVEIARTIYADAQVIIMDEPTSALGAEEREQLFNVIRGLKEKGRSVIFISHHLDEIMKVCDRISVLRDGKKVADDLVRQFTIERIINEMVGKSLQSQYPKESVELGKPILSIHKLTKKGAFEDISFELREGEILGVVGLEGCGKNEVIRSIFGRLPYDSGDIIKNGKKLKIRSVKDAMVTKIAFVPAERKVDGLFLKQNIAWNTTIASLDKIIKYKTLVSKKESTVTNGYIAQLNIKAESSNQSISALSGGNQQKVMLSRWIMMNPDVFLLEEPTRGIDVNAKTEVYRAIGECVKQKKGVIVVSSEEEEVIGICDRIIVMRNGKISGVLDAKKTNTSEIKRYSLKSEV
jgi:ribose transport system ATP-binding protein